jgi:hypothetical protein
MFAVLVASLALAASAATPGWLASEQSTVYFQGCKYSADYSQIAADLAACQQDLLDSPFKRIVFSFVNGAVANRSMPWQVDPFELDFANDGKGSDPWLLKGFGASDLQNFAYRLRQRGKSVLFSIGGGDAGEGADATGAAVGRIFTLLWRQSRTDDTVARRFV